MKAVVVRQLVALNRRLIAWTQSDPQHLHENLYVIVREIKELLAQGEEKKHPRTE